MDEESNQVVPDVDINNFSNQTNIAKVKFNPLISSCSKDALLSQDILEDPEDNLLRPILNPDVDNSATGMTDYSCDDMFNFSGPFQNTLKENASHNIFSQSESLPKFQSTFSIPLKSASNFVSNVSSEIIDNIMISPFKSASIQEEQVTESVSESNCALLSSTFCQFKTNQEPKPFFSMIPSGSISSHEMFKGEKTTHALSDNPFRKVSEFGKNHLNEGMQIENSNILYGKREIEDCSTSTPKRLNNSSDENNTGKHVEEQDKPLNITAKKPSFKPVFKKQSKLKDVTRKEYSKINLKQQKPTEKVDLPKIAEKCDEFLQNPNKVGDLSSNNNIIQKSENENVSIAAKENDSYDIKPKNFSKPVFIKRNDNKKIENRKSTEKSSSSLKNNTEVESSTTFVKTTANKNPNKMKVNKSNTCRSSNAEFEGFNETSNISTSKSETLKLCIENARLKCIANFKKKYSHIYKVSKTNEICENAKEQQRHHSAVSKVDEKENIAPINPTKSNDGIVKKELENMNSNTIYSTKTHPDKIKPEPPVKTTSSTKKNSKAKEKSTTNNGTTMKLENKESKKYKKNSQLNMNISDDEDFKCDIGKELSTAEKNIKLRKSNKRKSAEVDKNEEDIKLRMYDLHAQANEPVWVQCDSCSKWRCLKSVTDPSTLPDYWTCHLNNNEDFSSCSDKEQPWNEEDEEYFLITKFTLGSVVWVKSASAKSTWWPAMIDDDPDTEVYYWLPEDCMVPNYYHVTYFGSNTTRDWIKAGYVINFSEGDSKNKNYLPRGSSPQGKFSEAVMEAEKSLQLPLPERLKKFCFTSRYKGTWFAENN